MLHNLNMEGLKLISKLIGNMDEIEKYNVNTTPERFAEIERLQAEKDAAERIEREKRTKEQHFQYMKEQAKKKDFLAEALLSMIYRERDMIYGCVA